MLEAIIAVAFCFVWFYLLKTSKILRQGMETNLICKLCILNLICLPLRAWLNAGA